jgi:predicted MFS family arabinose efflux permease
MFNQNCPSQCRIDKWSTVLALATAPAVALGFGRFAYALLLPDMQAEFGLDYTGAGLIATANAFGHLAGALACGRYAHRVAPITLLAGSMAACSLALMATGTVSSFAAILLLRFIVGISGGVAFIAGAVIAGRMGTTPTAIYFCGAGAGIALSGSTLPFLLERYGNGAWGIAWAAMGVVSLAASWWAARAAAGEVGGSSAAPQPRVGWQARHFLPTLAAYFLFGAGYIVYMTFVIAWIREQAASVVQVALVWSTIGLVSVAAPWLWRSSLRKGRQGRPLALACLLLACGAALPIVETGFTTLLASALVFGSALFVVPAAITETVRRSLPPAKWPAALAGLTVVVSIGQLIGPMAAGMLGDVFGSLQQPLAACALTLLAAAGMSLLQDDR